MQQIYPILKKLIKTSAGRTRWTMAIVGLSISLLLLLASVQLQSNYEQLLDHKTNRDSIANFLVVNKVVTDGNLGKTGLSEQEIEEIKKQPFTTAIGSMQASRFKASIQSSSNMFPFYTDIAFESVPNEFIDVVSKEWKWEDGDELVPIIVPSMFLDMYNFQFSFSQGLPQLTRDIVKMIIFKVNIYDQDGIEHSFNGKVVGFSDRISSLLIPQTFMDWANQRFGTSKTDAPSRIIIQTNDPGDPKLSNYLKEKGLHTDQDKTRFSKYRQVVNIVVKIAWVTGALMFAFAMLIFTLFIQLTISACKDEIRLLIILGTSPKQLKSFLMKQFFPVSIIITVISLAIMSLLQWVTHNFLAEQQAHVSPLLSSFTVLSACLLILLTWITQYVTIRKYILNN